jgi:hypothetical protein
VFLVQIINGLQKIQVRTQLVMVALLVITITTVSVQYAVLVNIPPEVQVLDRRVPTALLVHMVLPLD